MPWTCCSGRFDGFCLVSSDSDFTRLASHIREHGVDVFGFGERKTPESFRQACRKFVYTENLLAATANNKDTISTRDAISTPDPVQPIAAVASNIKNVVTKMESEDGWVRLGDVGRQLNNLAPDFDPRTFGSKKLLDLVERTNSFDIDPKGGAIRIRIKPAAKSSARARTPKKIPPA